MVQTTISGYLQPPRLSGLLPAYAESLHCQKEKGSTTFAYENIRLAELSRHAQERLTNATKTLLDVALAFALGDLNEAALRAAEVLFHRAVAGPSTVPPRNPAEYCAEKDAAILDWCLTTSQTMSATREQASRDLAAWRQPVR